MYATSEKDLLKNLNDLITFAEPFPSYIERLENYFKRRTEWTFFDRQKHIIRGHNTNNFAESSIRIIKDVVLCRTKALNAVALTDFIVDAWEKYFCFKLLDFINGRRDSFLASRMDKTYDVPLSSCIQLTPQLYLLPSTTDSNIMYEINVDIGFCTCTSGRTGAFCKHQCFLFKKLNLELPNVPVLNLSERLQFAYIASGKKDLNAEFYKGNSEENSSVWIVSELPQENDQSCASKMEISETYRNIDHFASMEEKQELLSEFKRLLELPQSKNSVCKLTSAIKNKKSPEDMKSTLTTMALAVSAKNYTHSRTKKIKVQPTSICRRLKRGTNCIPKNVLQKKRLHNISKNINKNVPNAK